MFICDKCGNKQEPKSGCDCKVQPYIPPMEDLPDQVTFELLQDLWDEYNQLFSDVDKWGELNGFEFMACLADNPQAEKLRKRLFKAGVKRIAGRSTNANKTIIRNRLP